LGAALLAYPFSRTLAIGFSAFFVKFVGLVRRFVRGDFGNAFAFGSFIHSGRNVFVFVTRTILAFGRPFAKFIFFAVGRLGPIAGFASRITFARRAIVSAASASGGTATCGWGTASTSAAATATAFAVGE